MSFLSKIGKNLKRLARSKIVRGGLSAATGGLSEKAISVGKALGAVLHGGQLANKQNKSLKVRLAVANSAPIMTTPEIQPLEVRDITPSSRKRKAKAKAKARGDTDMGISLKGGKAAKGLAEYEKRMAKKFKKPKRTMRKPPSAAQLAAREKFKAMVAARRAAK